MSEGPRRPGESTVPGWSVAGAMAAGVLGLLMAVVGFFAGNEEAGMYLVASALAFGLVANATLRQ